MNPFVSSFVEDKGIGPVMDDPNAPFSNAWGGFPRNIPGVTDPGFSLDWESDAVPMPKVGDPNWGAKHDPGFEVAGFQYGKGGYDPGVQKKASQMYRDHYNPSHPYRADPDQLRNLWIMLNNIREV